MTAEIFSHTGFFSATATAVSPSKPPFSQVPQALVRDLCALADAGALTSAQTAQGGISASAAYVLTFDNGRRLFVKGSHPGDQSHGAANVRDECAAYRALGVLRDVAPAFCGLAHLDSGDDNGWWLGAWEAIDVCAAGYDAAALFSLLDQLQAEKAAPPAHFPAAQAHPYLSQFLSATFKWQRLRQESTRARKLCLSFSDPQHGTQWLQAHIGQFCALQEQAAAYPWRQGLLHGDLRCDNFIYGGQEDGDRRWYMIDWANAATGPLVFDRVMLAASLCADGACDAHTALCHASAGGLDEEAVLMAAMQAGYFADQLYRAAPRVMPRLRPLQKAMFAGLTEMLAAAGIMPPAPPMAA